MPEQTAFRHLAETVVLCSLLTGIVFVCQWSYGFNLGDEGLLWYLSQRVHFGEMAIRDFFGYDPGRYLWSAAWFKVLGANGLFEQRVANAGFGLIGLSLAYFSMLSAGVRRVFRILVVIALAIAMGFPLHKVYEQSLSLIGVFFLACALYEPIGTGRWFLAGIATGVIAIVGRNSGLYVALGSAVAMLAAWRMFGVNLALRSACAYGFGMVAGYVPMIVWFVVDGRFRRAMIESVIFTSKWQLPLPIPFPWRVPQKLSSIFEIQAVAISWLCVTVLLIYAVSGVGMVKKCIRRVPWDRTYTLELAALLIGLPFLHQSFDRADFGHIAQGILPVFVLLAARVQRNDGWPNRWMAGTFVAVSMAAWLPAEPIVNVAIFHTSNPDALQPFEMDGRSYLVDTTTAKLLGEAKQLVERCSAKDGQVVAMPYYPGVLAYLHLRSPYWEMFYLYQRSESFQEQEIASLKSYGVKLAIINPQAAMDGNEDLRFAATNPLLYRYLSSHFSRESGLGRSRDDVLFLTRGCDLRSSTGQRATSSN